MVDPKKMYVGASFGTMVGTAGKTSTPWIDTVEWDRRTWVVQSFGPNVLTSGVIEYTNDPLQAISGSCDATTFLNLGSASIAWGRIDASLRYLRYSCASGSGGGTVVWAIAP